MRSEKGDGRGGKGRREAVEGDGRQREYSTWENGMERIGIKEENENWYGGRNWDKMAWKKEKIRTGMRKRKRKS